MSINASTGTSELNNQRETCFVIMPFGGFFDAYYHNIYAPAIENSGLRPTRADDIYRPSNIVQDIWTYTKQAKLILADLTEKKPIVFYELGLAHALAKAAILLAETIEYVPFDLRALRVLVYNKNIPDWGAVLKLSIQQSIKEIITSPLKAVLPTFLDVAEISHAKISPETKALLEIQQEIELLKKGKYIPSIEIRGSNFSHTLDRREMEFMKHFREGLNQKQIALEMNLSFSYISKIKKSLMMKFGASSDWEFKEIMKNDALYF